jgi:hypothetical protein
MNSNLDIASSPGASPAKKKQRQLLSGQSVLLSQSCKCRFCGVDFVIPAAARKHEPRCNKRILAALNSDQRTLPAPALDDGATTAVQTALASLPRPVSPASPDGLDSPGQEQDPPLVPATSTFDLSFELAKFMWLSNQRRGMPDKDKETMLDIFGKAKDEGLLTCDLAYKNLPQFKVIVPFVWSLGRPE